MSRAKRILIALDQLVNAAFNGWPDETLSSRAYRWELKGKRGWPRRAIDALFFFDPHHCERADLSEQRRLQLPPSLRT